MEDIELGVKQVLAKIRRTTTDQVYNSSLLSLYCTSDRRDFLAGKIAKKFPAISPREQDSLSNQLFSSITTVQKLIDYVQTQYPKQ